MGFRSNHAELDYFTLIRSIREEGGHHYVVLDHSEFFPEGGGQPSDRGTIAGIPVLAVHEIADELWHEVPGTESFFAGMRVHVQIDEDYRWELSRQHTGQHLLSAVLLDRWGIQTIGFHIGDDTATIDTDRTVTEEMAEAAVLAVQQAILAGLPVSSFVETAEQLQHLGLRKATDLSGDVQIVAIGDIDRSACCGTHVDTTTDLLFFLIRRLENHKPGTRIHFQFGLRALDFAMEAVRIVSDAKDQLQIHETEIPFRIRLLVEQAREDERTIRELREKLVGQMLRLPAFNEPLVYQELDEDPELTRSLALELGRREQTSILLDLREDRIYGNIFLAGHSAGQLFKETRIPGVRGGGGPKAFQGIADSAQELIAFGRSLRQRIEEIMT